MDSWVWFCHQSLSQGCLSTQRVLVESGSAKVSKKERSYHTQDTWSHALGEWGHCLEMSWEKRSLFLVLHTGRQDLALAFWMTELQNKSWSLRNSKVHSKQLGTELGTRIPLLVSCLPSGRRQKSRAQVRGYATLPRVVISHLHRAQTCSHTARGLGRRIVKAQPDWAGEWDPVSKGRKTIDKWVCIPLVQAFFPKRLTANDTVRNVGNCTRYWWTWRGSDLVWTLFHPWGKSFKTAGLSHPIF